MRPLLLGTFLLISLSATAAESTQLDAALQETLTATGFPNPLRKDLQRPIDDCLLKIQRLGIEQSGFFSGQIHRVKNADEANALTDNLKPGDQLLLTGTTWSDAKLSFRGQGTAEAPILIRPEHPETFNLSGDAKAEFSGEHLVIADLTFKDGIIGQTGKIFVRLGTYGGKEANNCLVLRLRIENCNSPNENDWPKVRAFYVVVEGSNNTLADCVFAKMRNWGQYVSAQKLPAKGLLGLHILNCQFLDRPLIDKQNGYETIQIGWSGEHGKSSGSLIQNSLFEDCNGEGELFTVKASDVFIRGNTFKRCQGAVTLRHANRVLVQENIFDGEGTANTGGVRVCGQGHIIIGNTFKNLKEPKNYYYWPLSFMTGSAETVEGDTKGYGRAADTLIEDNIFESNDARIALGIYLRPDYPLLPHNIWITNNIFCGGKATNESSFDFIAAYPAEEFKKEIHSWNNQFQR